MKLIRTGGSYELSMPYLIIKSRFLVQKKNMDIKAHSKSTSKTIFKANSIYISINLQPPPSPPPPTPMETLSQAFTTFKTITILYINLLLLSLAPAIHSLIRRFSAKRIFTTTQFLTYLERKNPAVTYKKLLTRHRETPPACAVCLSEFYEEESVRDLKCQHVFHKACLDKWFLQCRCTCPLCRTKALPDKVVVSYRRLKDDEMEYDEGNEEMVFLVSHSDGHGFLSFWW